MFSNIMQIKCHVIVSIYSGLRVCIYSHLQNNRKILKALTRCINIILCVLTLKLFFKYIIHTMNSSMLFAVLQAYQKWFTMSFDHFCNSVQLLSCPACKNHLHEYITLTKQQQNTSNTRYHCVMSRK